ncbi:hypothetical protein PVK06_041339 [Gossypium arboreum]|uniref:Uncharacterized protein n=1 Tax=Gossypium arboreum TaxID=29729 RepID=A0ABR0N8A3_GOSAR|nr:hypothetical protein PVK06_041339 [Gossypium arboreum]
MEIPHKGMASYTGKFNLKGHGEEWEMIVLAKSVDLVSRMFYTSLEIALQVETSGTSSSLQLGKEVYLYVKSVKHGYQSLTARLDPMRTCVHLTTNGSVRTVDRFAAAGGFVCDYNGECVFGFNRYLGMCTVVDAKLWGILDGLKLTL